MIGVNEEQKEKQKKYFEFLHNHRSDVETVLKTFEKELTGNTFLNESSNVTVADLASFSFLYKTMQEFNNEDKFTYPNTYRWFYYM